MGIGGRDDPRLPTAAPEKGAERGALDEPVRPPPTRSGVLVDVIVAAAVFLYNLPIQGIPAGGASLLALLVPVGLCLPYVWRRRHPVAVFVVILLTAYVQLGLGIELLVADLMLVLALVGLAARDVPARSVPAAGLTIAWVVLASALHQAHQSLTLGDVAVLVLLPITAWVSGQLTRTRRQHIQGLEERNRQLEREREIQVRMAAAEERARIAREIHDVVSHNLSAVTLLADGAASTVRTDPEQARTAMITVRDTGREAMTQMRSMLSVLRSDDDADLGPQPGLADLDALVDEARAAGSPVRVNVAGDAGDLPAGTQLTIYRIVQESLTNVRKHAGDVDDVEVAITYGENEIEARVSDDGRGDPVPTADGPGHGLLGMRERVTALEGTLHTGPTGDGYQVRAVLPRRRNP
ncbi:sensor histidine kinase [Mobilicoccus caccae]|uniref:histidine kinase n=1 Tax=Mobilicoccus caccae TaxID=1859295 RepID=A0ABQ6IVU8_9MICO|nr:histidine kinase [Mobilicoccus caccae]GMA41741.1 two-component sensor histidine kinase [Mobilicoccus caccae]